MALRPRDSITTDGRSILLDLRNTQKKFKTGTGPWLKLQKRIDAKIAHNYLEYHIGKGVSDV